MASGRLTAKQERFAQLYVSGVHATEAYRQAYTVRPGTKDESVRRSAIEVQTNPNVSSRIDELQAPLAQQAQATAQAKRDLLWDIALTSAQKVTVTGRDGEQKSQMMDSRSAIAAMAELNKMDGDLAAIKTDNKNLNTNETKSLDEIQTKIQAYQERWAQQPQH